jgi:hypothetical protein
MLPEMNELKFAKLRKQSPHSNFNVDGKGQTEDKVWIG